MTNLVRAGLGAGGCDLQVLVVDEGLIGRVPGDVRGGPERFEIGGEGGLAGIVETAEGDAGGTEVFAKEGNGSSGVGGQVEVDGDKFGLDVREGRREAIADGGLVAPKDGRRDARRRLNVAGGDLEHLAGEAGGVLVGHSEQAAGFEDAGEFGGDELGAGGEHGSEHADDRIE